MDTTLTTGTEKPINPRWWEFRSWHPAVGPHHWIWAYPTRRSLTIYMCTGDIGSPGGSDDHRQLLYVVWSPFTTDGGHRIRRRLRVHPSTFALAVKSWWWDSEGFRGLLGPWRRSPDRWVQS